MPYHAQSRAVASLSPAEVAALANLYLRHYDASDPARVAADLAEKDEVILVRHGESDAMAPGGELVGFTTWRLDRRDWHGRPVRVVFSGDTVVDRAHWGQQALAFAWLGRMGALQRQAPAEPLYWFLIVKGHRTYKYLPVFGHAFHPHWSQTHPDLAALADTLAREKFGADYNPASGVVEFAESRGQLKPEIAEPGPEERDKPAVRFFLERNPGYRQGHELVCLCELSEANMKPLARRVFRAGLP